jgi:hypothetical protein
MATPMIKPKQTAAQDAPEVAVSGSAAPAAVTPLADDAGPAAHVLTVARTQAELPLPLLMRQVAADYGKTYNQIMMDIAKAGFGPGKLSVAEYFDLRLFDDAGLAGADKKQFLGATAIRNSWMVANFDETWMGLIDNKLATTTLLAGFGFPVVPISAIYAPQLTTGKASFRVLRTVDDVRAFMADPANYPMFAKPTDSIQSLGSVSLVGFDAASGMLKKVVGKPVKLDDFIADVTANYEGRYLFQKRLDPHAAIRAICGNRLATVRMVAINSKAGPEVLRAAWKIPAGENSADNFWRPANLLAQLDLDTGIIKRVVSGKGLSQLEVQTHPDTGAAIVGFQLPHWDAAKALARDAMQIWQAVGLIGWDIAITDQGPVIVEPNMLPDLHLLQIADRQGMMDARFQAFLTERKMAAAAAKAKGRASVKERQAVNAHQVMAGLQKG